MDTLGALALATEPPNDDLMKRTPVGRTGNFITNVMWRNILGQSLYQFVVIWYLQTKGKEAFQLVGPDSDLILNTLIFNSFVFCQVIIHITKLDSILQLMLYFLIDWSIHKLRACMHVIVYCCNCHSVIWEISFLMFTPQPVDKMVNMLK